MLFTVEVINWVPRLERRVLLIAAIWLLPVLGLVIANVFGDLRIFKKAKGDAGAASIAQGFMQSGAVFNPGMRHTIEMVDKQKSELGQKREETDEGPDGTDR